MSEFCHLHCHSEYSLLDGYSRIEDLVLRAKDLNQPAIALTDHGVMFGAIEFYRTAKKHGIKPIMGLEAYMAHHTMKSRYASERYPFHMLLLAQNQTGYQNLLKLSSIGQLEGFYQKPRIDRETLARHAEGLIATTGCLAAEVPRTLLREGERAAYEKLKWYLDVFGRERFFLELQGHDIPDWRKVNSVLLDWSRKHEVGLIATNDVHYVNKDDAYLHDVLLCIQTADVLSNPKRMQLTPHDSYYMTSTEEMAQMFSHCPDALKNTIRIAQMCEVDLDPKGYHLPIFPVPEGYDAKSYLRHLVEKGLVERYGERRTKQDPVLRERVERELGIIHNMGFDTYFLIVWDLCQFAAREDIWWNVRGSGAGSVVAYSLGITLIDPLSNDLIFERFLNPARTSMPDFDLDFPDNHRHLMIEYAVQRYGKDKCAGIITFGTLGAKAAVRDVGRTLGMEAGEINRLVSMIPSTGQVKLEKVLFDKNAEGEWPEVASIRQKYQQDTQIKKVLDTAMKLEGQTRHASTHAAGIVISDKPIVEYAPLHRPTNDEGPIQQVVQFDMNIVESIGLLKVDFLGLATLTVMRRACKHIAKRHGRELNLNNIPYERNPDDPEFDADLLCAYKLLQRGSTGLFQVEGAGMRRMLRNMQPHNFENIVAALALYRPGPMEYIPNYIRRMHGQEEIHYHHEKLVPILNNTYGIIIFQEQLMRITTDLAGLSHGEADLMRRAVAKKNADEMASQKTIFIEGCQENNIPVEIAEAIYGDIEYFARYGFPKAHAADYAVITMQTAYLKAHYPVEYLCALLEVKFDDTTKVPALINECRRLEIDILPPDINASGAKFTIEESSKNKHLPKDDYRRWGIRVGLGAIKNVGVTAVESLILAERKANGPFQTLDDFAKRVNLRSLGRRVVKNLAMVGSFDELVRPIVPNAPREVVSHKEIIDRMMEQGGKSTTSAQLFMFDMLMAVTPTTKKARRTRNSILKHLPPIKKTDTKKRLDDEKELLGVYISEHPRKQVASQVGTKITHFCSDICEDEVGQLVTIAGLLTTEPRVITTKNGEQMAFIKLEDFKGQLEVVVFPRTYAETQKILVKDQILLVQGKVNLHNDSLSVIADRIQPYQASLNGLPSLFLAIQYRIKLTMLRTDNDEQDLERLQGMMKAIQKYQGTDQLSLYLMMTNGNMVQIDFPQLSTSWNAMLKKALTSQNLKFEVELSLSPDAPIPLWNTKRP